MENFTVHDNFISGVETHDTKSTFEEGNTKVTEFSRLVGASGVQIIILERQFQFV